MCASEPTLATHRALLLGLLQGPTELLPVSSSAHVAIVPWLVGADDRLDDELRQVFEVALHTGTAVALIIALRGEALGALDARSLTVLAASSLPPALIGYMLERPVARRLSSPATIAAGLAAGAIAMVVADRAPQRRRERQAGASDGLWLGVAQACALVPGVSRNGATLAAARWRGFRRVDANRMSRQVAVPVIAGASALKAARLCRRGLPPGTAVTMAAGAGGAFVSTLACRAVIGQVERDRSPAPWALYRVSLAAVIVARMRRPPADRR